MGRAAVPEVMKAQATVVHAKDTFPGFALGPADDRGAEIVLPECHVTDDVEPTGQTAANTGEPANAPGQSRSATRC